MVFPDTVMPIRAEIQLSDGSWADVTTDVIRDPLTITRGRADEATQADAGRCTGTLNNRDGNYSPRLPTGAYYGLIGRNTPLRISLETYGDNYMELPGDSTSTTAAAPDSAGLSITGDIEIIVDVDFDSWAPADTQVHRLFQKWDAGSNQRSWVAEVDSNGHLLWWWSTNGTNENTSTSTIPLPFVTGRHSIKITHDVNNGAAGNDVAFYYADSYSGTYVQLGDTVTTAGTTSIFDSTSSVHVWSGSTSDPARYFRATVKQGIAGTIRGDANFTTATAGATSFSDGTNTWTLGGGLTIQDRDWRYHGAISAWPTRWDKSNTDRYVPFVADGVLRRLLKGDPVQSTIYRAMTTLATAPVAYWPMEDGVDATEFASATGGPAMTVTGGDPEFASYDGFNGSNPLPTLDTTTILRGTVPRHTATGEAQARALVRFPAAGVNSSNTEIMSVNFTGSTNHWQIRYETLAGGSLSIYAFSDSGSTLLSSTNWGFVVDEKEVLLSLELTQDGSDIDWAVATWEVDSNTSGLVASGTLASNTFGRSTRVEFNTNGGADDLVVGHCVVQSEVTGLFARGDEIRAWVGETAANRVQRLCEENGVTVRIEGNAADSPQMGPQLPEKLVDLLRDAAEVDGGNLFEARDFLGLRMRPRSAIWAQQARVAADCDTSGITDLLPVEDDRLIWNDVTVTRTRGSSARVQREDGPLAVDGPVGRNAVNFDLNLRNDAQLLEEAWWRLHLGTYEGVRFPDVTFEFGNEAIWGDATLWAALSDLDCGDRFLITDPPEENLPPDDIDLIVEGFTETLHNKVRTLTINTSPGEPWHVGVVDDPDEAVGYESRYDTDGSQLNGAHNSSTTSLSVEQTAEAAAAGRPLWTTDVAEFPFFVVIGGERIRVDGISGTTSPQTFTVVRSINGVVKGHDDEADVRLADPVYYGVAIFGG